MLNICAFVVRCKYLQNAWYTQFHDSLVSSVLEENAVQCKLSKIRYTKNETNLLLTHIVHLFIYLHILIHYKMNNLSETTDGSKLKHSLSATHLINLFQNKATKYYGGHLFQIFRDSPQNKT
jgi:hypothetical protein